MSKVRSYLSLIKFSHTIFAMPFAMIGFALAAVPQVRGFLYPQPESIVSYSVILRHYDINAPSSIKEVIIRLVWVVISMVLVRSAAMSFNRYLDRSIDAKNPRTAIREIPSGVISSENALLFTILASVLFVICTFFINPICFYLSPVALVVVLGYSYTKRFTPLCHLILGLGLSLAPLGAYLAVTGYFDLLPVLFSVAVIFWVSGFDIIYSLQDEEFDRSQKLYSIPAWLGKKKGLRISELLHLLSATAIILAGWYGNFGWLYWMGVAVFLGMLIYQHSIVKPNDLKRVNLAFMTANGIASVVFALFVITDLFIN